MNPSAPPSRLGSSYVFDAMVAEECEDDGESDTEEKDDGDGDCDESKPAFFSNDMRVHIREEGGWWGKGGGVYFDFEKDRVMKVQTYKF